MKKSTFPKNFFEKIDFLVVLGHFHVFDHFILSVTSVATFLQMDCYNKLCLETPVAREFLKVI